MKGETLNKTSVSESFTLTDGESGTSLTFKGNKEKFWDDYKASIEDLETETFFDWCKNSYTHAEPENKHTGGKWIITNENNSDYLDIDGTTRICSIPINEIELNEMDISLQESWANARLIAAAPDMLEALKLAKETIDQLAATELNYQSVRWHKEHIAPIEAAIAKATQINQ